MSYKKYLVIISSIALFGWISFILVITKLEPCTSPGTLTLCHSVSVLPLILFFLSVFFSLTATLTLMGFGLRLWLHRYEIYLDHLNISIRQGLLLSLCAVAALALLLLSALTWWTGMMLLGIIILLELYFTRET